MAQLALLKVHKAQLRSGAKAGLGREFIKPDHLANPMIAGAEAVGQFDAAQGALGAQGVLGVDLGLAHQRGVKHREVVFRRGVLRGDQQALIVVHAQQAAPGRGGVAPLAEEMMRGDAAAIAELLKQGGHIEQLQMIAGEVAANARNPALRIAEAHLDQGRGFQQGLGSSLAQTLEVDVIRAQQGGLHAQRSAQAEISLGEGGRLLTPTRNRLPASRCCGGDAFKITAADLRAPHLA